MRVTLARSPYRHYLEDRRVRQWVQNVEDGSEVTAATYFRRLGFICKKFDTNPSKLRAMDFKEAGEFLLEVVSDLKDGEAAGSYIESIAKALKSWWLFNDIEVRKKIKFNKNNNKYDDERVPTPQELQKILDHADLKTKVAIVLVAFGGGRIRPLGDYIGADGLKVSDFPEVSISEGNVEFPKIPTVFRVRRSLSKAGHQYISFLPEQGCSYLKEYLEWRMRAMGEKLTQDSPIITAHPREAKFSGHITSTKVGQSIREAIRAAGFSWRPYVLRRYFDMKMMQGEGDGLIIRDWRVFWMGHKGDIEHVYTLNKGQLPGELQEKMREGYAKAADRYLVTILKENMGRDMVLSTINGKLLEFAGYSSEEIEKMGDLSKLSAQQVQELVRKKATEALGLNSNSQKVVPMSHVKLYVQNGWEFVSSLPNEEAVIRLPRPQLLVK